MIVIIILLITTGILLIVLNFNAVKKEKKAFMNVLNNKKEDLTDYEVEIGKVKKEFSETILELQKEIEDLKDKINLEQYVIYKQKNQTHKKVIDKQVEIGIETEMEKEKEDEIEIKKEDNKNIVNNVPKVSENIKVGNNGVKIDKINQMLNEGLSVDEIAEDLGIGKGEVLLIKELYIK